MSAFSPLDHEEHKNLRVEWPSIHLRLVHASVGVKQMASNFSVSVNLIWKNGPKLQEDMLLYVHLLEGPTFENIAYQASEFPRNLLGVSQPFSTWPVNRTVITRTLIRVKPRPSLPKQAQTYALVCGV